MVFELLSPPTRSRAVAYRLANEYRAAPALPVADSEDLLDTRSVGNRQRTMTTRKDKRRNRYRMLKYEIKRIRQSLDLIETELEGLRASDGFRAKDSPEPPFKPLPEK